MSRLDPTKVISEFQLIGLSNIFGEKAYDITPLLTNVPRSKLQDYLSFLINYNLDKSFDKSFSTFIAAYYNTPQNLDSYLNF